MATPPKDAFQLLKQIFEAEGLGDFVGLIQKYAEQGLGADEVRLLIPETKEYKERFPGMESRRKKGLLALSERQYIQLENDYERRLKSAGLPKGFFDSKSDYSKFIDNDVSPAELDARIGAAKATVLSDNPAVRDTYKAWYASGLNEGDAIAAILDPTKAMAHLEKKVAAARLGGAASNQGLDADKLRMERLANMGVNADQAQQGFGQVADIQRNAGNLAARYGMNYNGQKDAEDAVFLSDSNATQRIKKLGQRESAEFGGRGVGDSRSLGNRSY